MKIFWITFGIVALLALIGGLVLWISHRVSLKELRQIEGNIKLIELARVQYADTQRGIAEKSKALRSLSAKLTKERTVLEAELAQLRERDLEMTLAIEKADLEALKKLIEGTP